MPAPTSLPSPHVDVVDGPTRTNGHGAPLHVNTVDLKPSLVSNKTNGVSSRASTAPSSPTSVISAGASPKPKKVSFSPVARHATIAPTHKIQSTGLKSSAMPLNDDVRARGSDKVGLGLGNIPAVETPHLTTRVRSCHLDTWV